MYRIKMLQLLFVCLICIHLSSCLKIYNVVIERGQPYKFKNENYPKLLENAENKIEYNFVADGEKSQIKIVCDDIKMAQNSDWTKDCPNVYFSTVENDKSSKVCNESIDNFVQKSIGSKLTINIVTTSKGSISYKCTAFNNLEPKAEIVKLHPNGKAVMIGELPEPVPYYDHVWEFSSPKGTRMSFQCVIGMAGITPVCGRNVFIFDDGEKINEYCESDYMVLFSKVNKARIRVQLDEAGDGYFECLAQAVTGPNANEYENVISIEVDSSEHGVTPGLKKTSCKCGWANKRGARIIQGKEARINEFPWMVYLEILHEVEELSWDSSCGASIITPRHILTAAHCLVAGKEVARPEHVQIVLGKHNSKISTKYERRVSCEEIFIRDIFHHKGISDHDIAIIFTKEKIEFNNYIGPICIEPEELPVINRRIIIMGWGLTEEFKASNYLRKSKARVMDQSVCGGNIWDVCTMTSPSATCSGDSGGPLVWLNPETNRYTQVSLVSRGHDDCKSTASLSTLIAYFYEWIQEIINRTDPTVATCGKV
uniref:Venom S1 protease 20 n=1 Tax=Platymeris rhadamanthus TaxID=1134088 RepID=A0A6B9KZ91_PLARH|nr:venom S1 protease 20 [Platymeris rhadamanthus]